MLTSGLPLQSVRSNNSQSQTILVTNLVDNINTRVLNFGRLPCVDLPSFGRWSATEFPHSQSHGQPSQQLASNIIV